MSSFQHFPSERDLEALANNLFKDLTGDESAIDNLPSFASIAQRTVEKDKEFSSDFDIKDPQTSLNDPFFPNRGIPKAVSGDGSSPDFDKIGNLPVHGHNGGIAPFQSLDTKQLGSLSETLDNTKGVDNSFNQHHRDSRIAGDLSSLATFPKSPSALSFDFFPSPTADIPFLDETYSLFTSLADDASVPKDIAYNPFTTEALSKSLLSEVNLFSSSDASFSASLFDVQAVRKDFPILNKYVNGHRLVWFDNAATTQKPQSVIDRLSYFYKHENSNIHRAAHELAARATDAYEDAREVIRNFINAASTNEIVFTRGTTESINLLANSWAGQYLTKDDEIIISNLEHHANIVPWQLLRDRIGFTIKVIPVNDNGEILLDEYAKLLTSRTRLVSFTHVSNALGTITPAKQIIDLAHQAGAKVILDGAQSISHIKVDVQELNPDFFVFSGHKIFGPTGIGVVYGKEEFLNAMRPYQGGGNMIKDVTLEKTVFHQAPNRFEAGTGNIADAVGLAEAIRYVQQIGIGNIAHYEHQLLDYATKLFREIPGVKLIGTAQEKTSVMSFTLQGYTNERIGQVLNEYGIAVRTGHHCAQPILRRLGYETSVRPSFAFYNTFEEIDLLASIVKRLAQGWVKY